MKTHPRTKLSPPFSQKLGEAVYKAAQEKAKGFLSAGAGKEGKTS